ncbi:saccharopine dehydrogenase [Diplocarpon rosae]|nr:saccharopine dehydrogenase [Diplocarpon rosae]
MGRMYDIIVLEPTSSDIGIQTVKHGRLYGEAFYYNEYYRVTSSNVGLTGWVKRLRAGHGKASLVVADQTTPIISLRAIAIADQDGAFPDRALAEFSYHGAAPDLVAALLAQGAATILYTRGLVESAGGGGVVTPAVLGTDFVERLGRVGVEIRGELI